MFIKELLFPRPQSHSVAELGINWGFLPKPVVFLLQQGGHKVKVFGNAHGTEHGITILSASGTDLCVFLQTRKLMSAVGKEE